MSSTQQIVNQHIAAVTARDLDRIMADYATNAILIDPSGTLLGANAIRGMFTGLLGSGLPLDPPTRIVTEGDLAVLYWETPPGKPGRQGGETLVIRDGKITLQTVVDFGPPPGGPPPR